MRHFILFCCWLGGFSMADLKVIRHEFLESAKHKKAAIELANKTDALSSKGIALITGYKGVSEIMKCKYACNPFSKIKYFQRGKQLLEQAIGQEPNNVELHYLRYTVQTNVPDFLQYNNKIKEDKNTLLKYVYSGDNDDSELYGMVMNYMLKSEKCSKAEITELKKIKNNNL